VLRIRPGHGWTAHRPGQFTTLGVDVDGVRHHRSYTITSLPEAPARSSLPELPARYIEVTVQAHRGGLVSEHLVHDAKVGDVVTLDGPSGGFTLPDRLDDPILFLSGGSGLTPIMAMLRHLVTRSMSGNGVPPIHPDVRVIHFVRRPEDLLFGGELAALGAAMPWLDVDVVTTRDERGRRVGEVHLCRGRLDVLCPDWRTRDTMACGPTELLVEAESLWAAAGCSPRLRVESFGVHPSAAHLGGGADASSRVSARFSRSGRSAEAAADRPLLVVAEDAGALPAAGCRMGLCHTCTTELTDGAVVDLRDGRRSEARRHVQLCVSAALTDVTLEL
jgi:ferredoxin-NADP reductase